MGLEFVLLFLGFVYALLMLFFLHQWRKTPVWEVPEGYLPQLSIAVVVPARNEAAGIAACLESLFNANYPSELLELWVVDDFSEDDTAAIAANLARSHPQLKLIRLETILPPECRHSANKKRAIALAVERTNADMLWTTDADCLMSADAMRLVASRFESQGGLQLVAAPVVFHREKNLLQYFQSLDILGMMGITAAGISLKRFHMGNGANLVYRREAFANAGGFEGNAHIASGDDMFLIQKVAKIAPEGVAFLKHPCAVVRTEAESDWKGFIQQRLRWGAKNAALPQWSIRLVLLLVWLFCCGLLVGTTASLFTCFPFRSLAFLWLLKTAVDAALLRDTCRFFGRKDLLKYILPTQWIHVTYVALIGCLSLLWKQTNWKGRKI